jgi:TonB-dependent receptor
MTRYIFASSVALAALISSQASYADAAASPTPAAAENGTDVVVTAARLENSARREQQIAPNLVNIQSAEAIAKYPDYNAAEALSRIPGVSLSIDTGEGRFVNIRGLDSNLNGATFGGAPLLNTQAGGTSFNATGRAVEFDTIPAGSIDRLVVSKTGLPDREAEGIGGSVELTPRSALTHDKFFFEGQLGEGYEVARKTTNLTEEVAFGGGFGTNASGGKLFHFVFAQNEHNDGRGFDDIEPGYLDTPGTLNSKTEDKIVAGYDLRRYRYHRERFGYYSELDVTPNANTRLYVRGSLAGYQETVNRQVLQINNTDGGNGTIAVDPKNSNGFVVTGATADNTLRDEKETHRNLAVQLGGEHKFDKLKLDWSASYVQATYYKPYDFSAKFRGPGDAPGSNAFNVTYDQITNAQVPTINVQGPNLADPSLFLLQRVQNSNEYAKDAEYSYHLNAAYRLGLTTNDELKFGGELRYRRKFDLVGNRVTYNAAGQPLSTLLGDGPFANFYGAFNVGYAASPTLIGGLFNANTSLNALGTGDTISANLAGLGGNTFNDYEDITSGYGQYSGHLGNLGFLIGARIENTRASYGGVVTTVTAAGTTRGYNTVNSSYTNVFPTAQLRYDFTPQLVGRATYSTGLARPGFLQTIQSGSIDTTNNPAGTVASITTGNPNLKPSYSNNFDIDLEYYLPNSGVLSFGLFDKEISDFVVSRSFKSAYPQLGAGVYQFNSFQNAQSTHVRGLEFAFVEKFSFLPKPFDGIGIDSNLTLADSKVVLTTGEPSVKMPGTAPITANFALFYEAHGLESRLSFKFDDRTIFGIGGGSLTYAYASISTNTYLDRRATLDYTGSLAITKQVKVYWSVKNITDAPLRYFEGNADRPIQREYYGQTYEAGVKVKF